MNFAKFIKIGSQLTFYIRQKFIVLNLPLWSSHWFSWTLLLFVNPTETNHYYGLIFACLIAYSTVLQFLLQLNVLVQEDYCIFIIL